MIEALKRLLSPEYMVVSEPGPVGALWPLYAGLALLFAAGLVAAAWLLAGPRRDRKAGPQGRGWAWLELWVCLVGLATVAGRFLGWPGWSARIWPYSLATLSIAGWLIHHWRARGLPSWLETQIRVLTFSEAWKDGRLEDRKAGQLVSSNPPSFHPSSLLLLLVHLAGIALVLAARVRWPVWAAPPVLAVLLLPQWPLLARRRMPRLIGLTPLLAAYAVTLLWLAYQALGITIIGWQGQAFPNPLVSLFYVDGILLATVAYSFLCQLHLTLGELGRPADFWRWAVAGLLVLTLAWAGIVYFGKRTHGATATDPYAYAQMGVDLAEHGTFLHRFSLFQEVIPLEIAWAPLQPLGYHIPRNDLGDCPSVWATGASVLLAAGYWLLGETGLYVTTPVVGLLALAATWALVHEALYGQPKAVRYASAALAVALLATSPENVDRLLVPMADAPALLFTTLALLFALRAMRALREARGPLLSRRLLAAGVLGGACFAWAYWVRHTQIVLALPVVVAVAAGVLGSRHAEPGRDTRPTRMGRADAEPGRDTRPTGMGRADAESSRDTRPTRMGRADAEPGRDTRPTGTGGRGGRSRARPWVSAVLCLAVFALVALIAALPDIVYRWRVFGGLLRTETTELPLMGLAHIGPVAWQMLRDALVAGEWGYLFPFALYGAYRLGRTQGRAALVLGVALAAVLLVHLTYRSLRLRDLISLFSLVDLAVAYGAVSLVRRARAVARTGAGRLGPALLAAGAIAWVILSLAMARWAMIDNLWKPGWASFGYMRAEHRAAFDRLAELTPPNAVIGASLNSGAVMMLAGRDAIRPYDSWTRDEWGIFLDAMESSGRPVYLLDDGGLMAEFINAERAVHRLTPIEPLQVPLFYTQDREIGMLYRLEWAQ